MEIVMRDANNGNGTIADEKSFLMFLTIRKAIEELMHSDDGVLVLNCRDLDSVDSGGLGMLVAINTSMLKLGKTMIVKNPNDALQELFRITNLLSIIKIVAEEDRPNEELSKSIREIAKEIAQRHQKEADERHLIVSKDIATDARNLDSKSRTSETHSDRTNQSILSILRRKLRKP